MKDPSWDTYQMTKSWEESTSKSSYVSMMFKKIFTFLVMFFREENIFSIFLDEKMNKWSTKVFSKKIIYRRSHHCSSGSKDEEKNDWHLSLACEPSSGNHNEFRWYREKCWFKEHSQKNSNISKSSYSLYDRFYKRVHSKKVMKMFYFWLIGYFSDWSFIISLIPQ